MKQKENKLLTCGVILGLLAYKREKVGPVSGGVFVPSVKDKIADNLSGGGH